MIIPSEALKNHIAIIGKAGSGKTFCAKGIAEGLLDAGERVCIIDPTGVWHGLRSKANGKSGAYPVVIFGGEHGDVPLNAVHGEAIAEIIATSNTPAIIDVSLMRVGERTRFFTDFASELLRRNKGPLHLIIDEAHVFAPQGRVADPQSGNMLHAANNLISLGRARGLRVTLITQRPAKLHKDSLSQVETLIALRLIAPQDRKAVEDWIADQADREKGRDIIASLPSLPTGQGYVWAPELGILKKATFPRIKTFDSSRTPEDGTAGDGPVLAPIDMATISGKLVAIKEEADANDPAKLKAKIRELEKKAPAPAADPDALVKASDEGYRAGRIDGYREGVKAAQSAFEEGRKEFADKIFEAVMSAKFSWPQGPLPSIKVTGTFAPAERPKVEAFLRKVAAAARPSAHAVPAKEAGLTRAQQRVVNALGFWANLGHAAPTRAQVAAVSGYSVKSSGFDKTLSQLSTMGVISRAAGGNLALVEAHAADRIDTDTARQKLLSVLQPAQRRVLDAFNGTAATKQEIADRSQYSATSSGFEKTLSQLSSIGIVTRPAPGMVDLADWVRELL